MNHLVRVGAMAHVGRFRAAEPLRRARGERVVVRTRRGLEVGEVLAPDAGPAEDGVLLRRMSVNDELLAARLQRSRDEAYAACVRLLSERGSAAALIDVEHLFDGRGLYFYFLGEPDTLAEELTTELAAAYDAEARVERFAATLAEGCGPGCGTAEAKGSGGCATCVGCAVAGGCGSGR